jgi:type IV pilus assembly protein PilA
MAMSTRVHRARGNRSEAGFTLVELLVVLVILALIAAIAIPAFFSQAAKGRDASAKSAARTAEEAAEVLATDNTGKYSGPNGVTVENLRRIEPTLNNADLSVSGVSDDGFTVTVTSLTGNTFSITRHDDGTTDLTCTFGNTAGCPEGRHWGPT